MKSPLRVVSYLSPSLPEALFRCICEYLSAACELDLELHFDSSVSGPPQGTDPFTSGEIDAAFLCAPSVNWLASGPKPAIEVVPAAPVFDDPRLAGLPRYFSDVVVHEASGIQEFGDLAGARWGYNDPCSLSGYFSGFELASTYGDPGKFFAEVQMSGSHLECLRGILAGELDAAAIDSNTLLWQRRTNPALESLRVIASLGPYPIQPLVVARRHAALAEPLSKALDAAHSMHSTAAALRSLGVVGFGPVSRADYVALRPQDSHCWDEPSSAQG